MAYPKLRGRIVERYKTVAAFAEAWGRSRQNVDNKLHGRTEFSMEDIKEVCNLLEICTDDIPAYFFAE